MADRKRMARETELVVARGAADLRQNRVAQPLAVRLAS
jgi:hypothetical protein